MKLSGLKFVIKDILELNAEEKNILTEAYHNLFIKTYGPDVVDAFSYVTKTDTNELVEKNQEVKVVADNYKRAIQTLRDFEEDANCELLLIYYDNVLAGGATLIRIDEEVANVPEIAIINLDKDSERNVWTETVIYIMEYFTKKGYKKMYLEIPLKEGPLLVRAGELGFKEDPKDIVADKKVYTYVLNKDLEGSNNE